MQKKLKTFTIRIDEDLYNQLSQQAEAEYRTLNNYINLLLLRGSLDEFARTHEASPIIKPRFKTINEGE